MAARLDEYWQSNNHRARSLSSWPAFSIEQSDGGFYSELPRSQEAEPEREITAKPQTANKLAMVEQGYRAGPLHYRLSDRVRIGCARGLAIGAAMNPTPQIDRACTWLIVACAIVFLP